MDSLWNAYVTWPEHTVNLCNAKSFLMFRNSLLKIGRPMQNSIYNIHDPVGIKYLTRLRLGLSHLNEHKFRHNFQDCLNPLCSCSLEVETTNHSFLHCHYYSNIRKTLLDTVKEITDKCLFPWWSISKSSFIWKFNLQFWGK